MAARLPTTGSAVIVPLLLMVMIPAGKPEDRGSTRSARSMATAASAVTSESSTSPAPAFAGTRETESEAEYEASVSSADVCVDAGYLCIQLEQFGSLRIIHFPVDMREIRVHVPLPDHESPERARALRAAAAAGISAWEARPFPIRFVDESEREDADMVVEWELQLPDGGLGETRSRFHTVDDVPRYRVANLSLATRNPYDEDVRLDPEDVELTAAHEMGHALGLPHSDDRGDLMYPTDVATNLSERDFRTLEALYQIPNGTTIVK